MALQPARAWGMVAALVNHLSPRALVVLRVPRGAEPPAERDVRAAIEADRSALGLPLADVTEYRLAGPYALDIGGEAVDEYVAWEV